MQMPTNNETQAKRGAGGRRRTGRLCVLEVHFHFRLCISHWLGARLTYSRIIIL